MACENHNLDRIYESPDSDNYFNILPMYTQCFLVLKALEHGLEEEVMELADSILQFSIMENESDVMWYNYYNVYGFDLLGTMAAFDEKYLYLLFKLVTPNWDEEHTERINQYLYMDVKHLNRAKLKALACGSNYHALRCNFLTYTEIYEEISTGALYPYFKANPADYAYFKQELFNSLRETPRHE